MAEQGGHKVGRETRLGFGLVNWSFDYESAATISQCPRPAPSLLTTACATTTTTYWSVLCRQATTQIQLPANLIVLVAEPRKLPGREERGRGARGSECEQRALAPASNEAWNFSALATVSSFFLLPLALLDISDTLVEGICVLSRKPKLYEVELTEVLLRNMPCKQYENLLQTL